MSPTNLPASIHSRLLKISKERGRPFNEILQYYGIERFLFRLSCSRFGDQFILKGAVTLHALLPEASRFTQDIDFLASVSNDVATVTKCIAEVCEVGCPEDGMDFEPKSVRGKVIKEGADYEAVQVALVGRLGNMRIPINLDVAFGDTVTPAPHIKEYPSLLSGPAAKIKMYPKETIVAEKYQAIVALGLFNSRMKDFSDLWFLSKNFDFDGQVLSQALMRTFERRKTKLEAKPVALTSRFVEDADKQKQWAAFIRRTKMEGFPRALEELVSSIRGFLGPVVGALDKKLPFTSHWLPGGPWK